MKFWGEKFRLGYRLWLLRGPCDSIITKQEQDWKPAGRMKLSDWRWAWARDGLWVLRAKRP